MQAKPPGSSDRAFGLVFAAFFLVVALLPLWNGREVRLWSLGLAAAFLAVALAVPSILAPLNRVWTAFGNLLHRIVSPVALAILFYGVVAPTGLLMRLFGKDPLRLKRDPAARSYWLERRPPGPPADSLKDQF
jgi:hypothetical protein